MDDKPLNPAQPDKPTSQNPPSPPQPEAGPTISSPWPEPPTPASTPPQTNEPLPDWASQLSTETPPPPTPQPEPIEQPSESFSPPPPSPPPPPPAGPPASSRFSSILSFLLKIFLGIVVLILIVFLGTRIFAFIQEKQAPKTVTLTYWGLWEDKNIMASVISNFEREHQDIKINYQKRDIKQYRETLKARIASGGGPDIFRFHNSWLPMFTDDLLPLPKDVIGEKPQTDFYPVVTRDLKVDGAYFGVPLEIDTLLLFVNKDLFKTAGAAYPKTWNEIKITAPLLTVKDVNDKIKTAGVALGTYDNVSHASDIVSLMFVQNGVDLKNIGKTSKNAEDALLFYTTFAKGRGSVWDETLDSSVLAFAKGNLAMFFGYSWDIFTIQAINPNLNFEVIPVPQITQDNKVTLASYWAEGVSKKSKNQKAAFQFLAYLNRKDTLQKLYSETAKTRAFGEPPSRVDLADQFKDNPYLSVVTREAKDAVSTPFSADTFDNGLNSELNKYLSDAVRAVLGNTSPETAVETLTKGAASVFIKYGVR